MVSSKNDEDRELVKRCQAGDKKAFEGLVIKYQRRIFNLCYRMLLNRKKAEEAAQESFMRAYKNIKKFRGESAFSTWLYRIALNYCIDILRDKERRGEIFFDELMKKDGDTRQPEEIFPSTKDDPVKTYEKEEIKKRVREAIAELNENRRTVVLMVRFEGLSYKETAEILNEPEGTIKSKLSRALKKDLRGKLNDLIG